jgi:hypothetical protein
VVGGLIEQEYVGMLHQRLYDCETLLPAARQLGGVRFEIFKTSSAESLGKARPALRSGHTTTIESAFYHRTHRGARFKSRILLDAGEACPFAKRYFPAVGSDFASQNAEQSGFAGSVWANQSDTVPVRNGERNILEKRVRSECFRNFLRINNWRQ